LPTVPIQLEMLSDRRAYFGRGLSEFGKPPGGGDREKRGIAMTDQTLFQEGYDAYWQGVDPDDNPYVSGSEQSDSWDEGWSQAQLEDDDAGTD